MIDVVSEFNLPSINSMSNSEYGYLYFGSKESIYRYDGKGVDPVDINYSIPFTEITDIQEDSIDRIYFRSNNQLMKFGSEEPFLPDLINTYEVTKNYIYYGTDSGVKVFDRRLNLISRPQALVQLELLKINDLMIVDENVIIASDQGLFSYDISSERLRNFSKTEVYDVQKLHSIGEDEIWAYDDRGRLLHLRLENSQLREYENQGFEFTDIAVDSMDRIWFGTSTEGILIYDTSLDRWKTVNQKNGLPDNRVIDILVDAWGSVWISTADKTLSKYIDLDFTLLNVYDGLPSDEVTTVASYESELLFSCASRGIYKFENREVERVYPMDIKSEAIFKDSSNLWIGSNGEGLIIFDGLESTVLRKSNGLPSNWVNKIVQDTEGVIWIASPSNGIASIELQDSSEFKIRTYGQKAGLKDENISALYAHSSGRVFYGSQSGKIGFFLNSRHYPFTSDFLKSEITGIIENAEGDLYISSISDGIIQIRLSKTLVETKIEAYPNDVKSIAFKDNVLWSVNDRGISNGEILISSSDGLPSRKISKSSMLNHQGRIWLASMDGIISLGDIVQTRIEKKPKIYFEKIELGYERSPLTAGNAYENIILSYTQNQINFEFEGVDIHSNRDLYYSYMLEGRDKEWSSWSKSDNISINNISPGSYNFKVRARSNQESISDTISFSFTSKGPMWTEWWFIPSIVLFFGLLAYLIFRRRLIIIRRKNEEEKAKLELRNKLLELEQKAKQLQMNPHFIFNALNSIQATVAKEDYQDARREITDFATLMRSILSNSKERVISLNDELLLLRKYIEIEKKSRGLNFQYKINVDEKVDGEEILIPPMLIQPFVENAIVHGLAKKENGSLELTIKLMNEEYLEVKIIDNGIGYENSKSQRKTSKHKSVAIEVTKERLEAVLNKNLHPAVQVGQVSEEGGTEVLLKIPVEYNF